MLIGPREEPAHGHGFAGHAAAGVIARFHRHPAAQIIQRDLVQIGHAAQLEQVQACREIRAIRFERIL